jgi:hypothetical protein
MPTALFPFLVLSMVLVLLLLFSVFYAVKFVETLDIPLSIRHDVIKLLVLTFILLALAVVASLLTLFLYC